MKEDIRTLNPEAQHQLRRQVVRLKESGRSSTEIAEITGLGRQSVNMTWRNYQNGGFAAIKLKTRGRSFGDKRRLSAEEEKELKRLMIDKTPEQLKFKFALWTRSAVKAVVGDRFGIDLPLRTKGKVRFMVYKEKMNSAMFIKFMSRLVKDSPRKIFLIVDNLRVHHSKPVKEWLAMDENREKIELFFLPSYSPELNPDERLNGDLKCQVQSGLIARTKEQVKTKVHSAMKSIQRLPERVKKYFRDPISAYASAR